MSLCRVCRTGIERMPNAKCQMPNASGAERLAIYKSTFTP
jgi:hypothetical protein